MIGLNRQSVAEVQLPILQALIGKSRDQIETDVFESRFSKQRDRAARVIRSVRTAQRYELAVEERLDADARAIYPDFQPPIDLRSGKCRWINFDRNFRVAFHNKRRTAREDEFVQLLSGNYRGRPAAKVYRVHRSAISRLFGKVFTPVGDLAAHGADISPGQLFKKIRRIEIAVSALACAKGDVNIDASSTLHSAIISR